MTSPSYFPDDGDKPEIPTGPKVHQLAGLGPARVWADQLITDFNACRAGKLRWDQLDPGALISGPPGTGKTTLASAIAASLGIPIIITGFNKWSARNTSNSGEIIAAIGADFDRANAIAPCLIFIDELDSIPSRGIENQNTTYFTLIVNVLLKRTERRNLKDGVIVLGATNHEDRIDPALKRSGRFDRHLQLALPGAEDLVEILAFHLKADRSAAGALGSIAILCTGKSGADIEKLVRDARRIARQAGRPLARADLLAAIEQDAPKLKPAELKRVAFHEAGHAAAVYRLRLSDDVSLSLLGPDGSGGVMRAPFKSPLLTEFQVLCRLIALLAGRAAEETYCEDLSSGAGGDSASDIAQATKLAIRAYDDLALRSVWHGPTARQGAPAGEDILLKARRLLDDAYARALEFMDLDREFITRIADALVKQRALSHADIAALDPGEPGRLPASGKALPAPPPPEPDGYGWDDEPSYANPPLPWSGYDSRDAPLYTDPRPAYVAEHERPPWWQTPYGPPQRSYGPPGAAPDWPYVPVDGYGRPLAAQPLTLPFQGLPPSPADDTDRYLDDAPPSLLDRLREAYRAFRSGRS